VSQSISISERRLHHAYRLLREVIEDAREEDSPEEAPWYAPPLLPIDPGSRMSATDLLSWWFRPPTASASSWDAYFGANTPEANELGSAAPPQPGSSRSTSGAADPVRRAVFRALIAEDEYGLAAEDADSAVEVLYEFLHAFARRDVEGALQYVAEDYHTFEEEREVNRRELANRLEALLASLHGWDFSVSLAMVPEPLRHPYGIVIYAEIQIDAVDPVTGAKRNLVERRLVLLEQQSDKSWKLAAFSRVRS
jgi:hypothetical protein